MSSSAESGNNRMVSPVVTSYSPNAFINVDSALRETVVVNGIDSQFDISLNETEAIKILNGFTVSGFYVDCRLGKKDPELTNLAVDLSGALFESVIAHAIDTAVNSASPNETIDKYLANQLRNAFKAAFTNYLPVTNATGIAALEGNGDTRAVDNDGDATQTGQPGTSGADPAKDDRLIAGSVAVTVSTTISGFKVDVLTEKAAAAAALVAQHKLVPAACANIFRQIPKASWVNYLPANHDASGWAVTYLETNALPMLKNDVLTFVFDMDVATAGSNADVLDVAEDVPVVPAGGAGTDQSTGYGIQNFSLNLANRRVALNLRLTGQTGAFTVGGADGLRAQTSVGSAGVNPGPGTNAADGGNTGSAQ